MATTFYKVQCLTDLHMGSGDVNFNIVDNEIQRDEITKLPIMHASGVKGALRSFWSENIKDDGKENAIFGKGGNESNPGSDKFLSGHILFLAVRASAGEQPYYLVTCKEALKKYYELRKQLGVAVDENIIKAVDSLDEKKAYADAKAEVGIDGKNFVTEKDETVIDALANIADKAKIVIISTVDMQKIDMPVMARNVLDEKGLSKNLWYEEVVPHESIFYIPVISKNNELKNGINGQLVQFGANASIGYGLTKITVME